MYSTVQTYSQSFTYVTERTIDYKRKCFDMLCLWLCNSLQETCRLLAVSSIDPLTLSWKLLEGPHLMALAFFSVLPFTIGLLN